MVQKGSKGQRALRKSAALISGSQRAPSNGPPNMLFCSHKAEENDPLGACHSALVLPVSIVVDATEMCMLSHHMCSPSKCRLHGHEKRNRNVKGCFLVAFGSKGDAKGLQDICRMEGDGVLNPSRKNERRKKLLPTTSMWYPRCHRRDCLDATRLSVIHGRRCVVDENDGVLVSMSSGQRVFLALILILLNSFDSFVFLSFFSLAPLSTRGHQSAPGAAPDRDSARYPESPSQLGWFTSNCQETRRLDVVKTLFLRGILPQYLCRLHPVIGPGGINNQEDHDGEEVKVKGI